MELIANSKAYDYYVATHSKWQAWECEDQVPKVTFDILCAKHSVFVFAMLYKCISIYYIVLQAPCDWRPYFLTYLNFLLATYRIVNRLHSKTLSQFLGKIVVVNELLIKSQAKKIFSFPSAIKNCTDIWSLGERVGVHVYAFISLQVYRFLAIKYLRERWSAWLDRIATIRIRRWKSWTNAQNLDKFSSLCYVNQTIHFRRTKCCVIEEYLFRVCVRFIRSWCRFT